MGGTPMVTNYEGYYARSLSEYWSFSSLRKNTSGR